MCIGGCLELIADASAKDETNKGGSEKTEELQHLGRHKKILVEKYNLLIIFL